MPRLERLLRLRLLLPLLAVVALSFSVRLLLEGEYRSWVVYDYSVWLAVLLVCLGVYLDVKLLGGRFGYASTLLVGVCGAAVTVAGRIASLILNQSVYAPYKLVPLFGSSYSYDSFVASLVCLISGSLLASVALAVHSLLGRPLVFFDSAPLSCAARSAWSALVRLNRRFWAHRWLYLLAAFLFGFAYRFGPEIVWWPWLIGWDTVEYAAHLMDFLEGLNPLASYHWMGSMRNCPPLLNVLLCLPALAVGAWNAFKVYPSVAYGLLAMSSALAARRVFGLGGFRCFLASAVTALFVLNLRISWDYQRQLLGSVFMLLSIAALDSEGKPSLRRSVVSGVLLACCALSHEVTALFSAALSLLLAYRSIRLRDFGGFAAGLAALAVSVGLEAWYWRMPYTPNAYFGVAPVGVVSYSSSTMSEVLGYFAAGFGLILPFAVLALLDGSRGAA
ncbi:MAG: hypothetical protein QW701_07125, partial [Candidatus Nezhaarchaeales archaeon]